MNFLIIKRTFILNYKKIVVISGTIKYDIKNPISEFNALLINNSKIPIEKIEEAFIENNSYIAFTFKLDGLNENLLDDIIKSNEGREVEIV